MLRPTSRCRQGAARPVRARRAAVRHPASSRALRVDDLAPDVACYVIKDAKGGALGLLSSTSTPAKQARRRLDGRVPAPPAARRYGLQLPGGLPGVQLHPAAGRQAGAADPRRGHHAVPRVRSRPASPADPRRPPGGRPASTAWPGTRSSCRASSWRTGAGSAEALDADLAATTRPASRCRRTCSTSSCWRAALPVRLQTGAPARVRAVRLAPAPRLRPGARGGASRRC
jgi:hypothetical protein